MSAVRPQTITILIASIVNLILATAGSENAKKLVDFVTYQGRYSAVH